MGANTEAAIIRAAQSVTALQEISTKFDKETGILVTRNAHSTLNDTKDVNSVVAVIIKKKILDTQNGRMHSSFKNFSPNPLHNLDQEKVLQWISTKQKQIKYKCAVGEGDQSDSEASDIDSDNISDNDEDSYCNIETEILSFV